MFTKWTAIYEKGDAWWIAQVEELPGAFTQGATLEEARENLKEVVQLMVQVNRDKVCREFAGKEVVREELEVEV